MVDAELLRNAGRLGLKGRMLDVLLLLDSRRTKGEPERLVYGSSRDLGHALGCDRKTAQKAVNRLESAGFIERRGDTSKEGQFPTPLWSLLGYDRLVSDLDQKAVQAARDLDQKAGQDLDQKPGQGVGENGPGPGPKNGPKEEPRRRTHTDHLHQKDDDEGEAGTATATAADPDAVAGAQALTLLPRRHHRDFNAVLTTLAAVAAARPARGSIAPERVAACICAHPNTDPLQEARSLLDWATEGSGASDRPMDIAGTFRTFLDNAKPPSEGRLARAAEIEARDQAIARQIQREKEQARKIEAQRPEAAAL